MPLLPASLIEPLWVEFAALIGTADRPEYDPAHPLGCHRHRVDDRAVFDCVIAALVHAQRVRAGRGAGLLGPHDPASAAGLGPAWRH